MSIVLRRNLVLVNALIYLVFACGYVMFCSRNTGVINLLNCFHPSVSKQKADLVIKRSSAAPVPVSHKFASRPRVIVNRISLPVFLTTIILLPFITFYFRKSQDVLLSITYFLYPRRILVFNKNWRI